MIRWRIVRVYRVVKNGERPVLFNSVVDNLRIKLCFQIVFHNYACFCEDLDHISSKLSVGINSAQILNIE